MKYATGLLQSIVISATLCCACSGTKTAETQEFAAEQDVLMQEFTGEKIEVTIERRIIVPTVQIDSLQLTAEQLIQITDEGVTTNNIKIHPQNPFAAIPDFRFEIIDPDSVCIRIYTVRGGMVAELFRGRLDIGKYSIRIPGYIEYRAIRYDCIYNIDIGGERWFYRPGYKK